ncbi:hypothetical protein PR001_g23942 [Phytophthora rubi]|uniref:RNase H type-1 domain-containing protein n=2 Tax=Phytophthora rubi TaxID=129364 RepID=A0A6A3II25_9STRA|nr:hypothetical protein PR001_g23942 [Phytophthora rubi]
MGPKQGGARNDWAGDAYKVGFFDGGSRGNPGPGGSGSVIIEMDGETGDTWPIWAAATALGRRDTTNNLAEFIGLHRLLAHAVAQDSKGLHVVGDSAMILRMMRTKKRPKAKKLQALFNTTSRLADICRVESWSHHYREHNKMADWLANVAMDNKKSVMITFRVDGSRQEMEKGLETRMEGDMRHWEEKNTKDATATEGQQREA